MLVIGLRSSPSTAWISFFSFSPSPSTDETNAAFRASTVAPLRLPVPLPPLEEEEEEAPATRNSLLVFTSIDAPPVPADDCKMTAPSPTCRQAMVILLPFRTALPSARRLFSDASTAAKQEIASADNAVGRPSNR